MKIWTVARKNSTTLMQRGPGRLYREAVTELSNPRSLPLEGPEQSEQNSPS
jgi:hypothetical protein